MVLLKDRIFRHGVRHAPASTANHDAAITDLRAPAAYLGSACSGVCSKFVHTSSNKDRCPVNVCVWTSEGRRLLTGTHNGMFTLWSGLSFNFETTQQAHETAVRVAVWSHREEWMISGDHAGILKYWQTTLNCVKEFEAHPDTPIRDLAYCPTDAKYASMVQNLYSDIPTLMPCMDLGGEPLPLLWTADYIPKNPDDWAKGPYDRSCPDEKTEYVVGEFNCSCVGISKFQAVCGGEKTLADIPDEDYYDACLLTELMGIKAIEMLTKAKP